MTDAAHDSLLTRLLAGEHRALARAISIIEDRRPGYRDLVSDLHQHTGNAAVIGITGSPGAGKSTLVDKLAATYRERGDTVGVIAIDPSSPFTGGAVLGDRIRMASNVGDMDVFFRSMSARGALGGLSTATADAVKALDAFGKDTILIETVGAGQNEIDVVRTADTVAVLVPPGAGDNVQMLKAGILEIGDVFVVNKADMDGADRTMKELREMISLQGEDAVGVDRGNWTPELVRTVATTGDGVQDLIEVLAAHREYLVESGRLASRTRMRYAEEIRTLLRNDVGRLLEAEIEARGGMDDLVERVIAKDTDPYGVVDDLVDPIEDCLDDR